MAPQLLAALGGAAAGWLIAVAAPLGHPGLLRDPFLIVLVGWVAIELAT